ncbi:MAG: NAD-dependent epimerase/dehydratase family protein [Cyanobacteria bacterium J06642_2]
MNLTGKTLLITGIGGFIGLRTAELAIARGITVRGLQRTEAKAKAARACGAEVIVGDVADEQAALAACKGADIVLHTAARVKEDGSLDDFRHVNVTGSLTMARAAHRCGVKSFIHLSSVMVYGYSYPDLVTEDAPLRGENNPYCMTKIEAEKQLLKLNQPPQFGITILRPGDVYGPGSTSWVLQPLSLMKQKLFMLANGGMGVMNHVYVDNLVEAIFLTIEAEYYGQVFNITDGARTSWHDYFTRLASIAGYPTKLSSLPGGILKTIIRLRGFGQQLLGGKPDFFPASVDYMTRPHPYSIAKARKFLGYEPKVDLEQGMSITAQWLEKERITEKMS